MTVNIGIVGGTGYTGVELLRLLSQHPQAKLQVITSRSEQGVAVAQMFPNLRGHVDLKFELPDSPALKACDVVFFATPHGVAMAQARELLANDVRVIDLAADFRLKDIDVFKKWYEIDHSCPDILADAVYGLPELNREDVRKARVIGNPGCYPTSVQLGFAPLLRSRLIDPAHMIANSASGVSGAGKKASTGNLFSEVSDSFKAYAVKGHRHGPEINEQLRRIDPQANVLFLPHLIPSIRGIHSTLYARLNEAGQAADLQSIFEAAYVNEPFVDVMPAGSAPETRSVRASNFVRIAVHKPQPDTVVVLVVEDNLVKGAAGQAVQCMNLMFGLPETMGLTQVPILP
ncbi:N-acetyl-gamma-glutamyl-phosphate reductase [Saezia sanguinis]|jgi:N-acetyl-gamma-glutamyl-phosphate reductase|uniref:N-acetyl-gamma-glutamyl-phosphate reductase n=1 Tax=Saezia sanguinis TaxID=1965230 RepID=A0A433SAL4_9BURK|nr:N-acetyl-gamma-glutamyl-phosphate reductase [Saezia sanguinis]RUS65694.1 N-acetyl-gamma-glutamyl-phosphate reductase [Saezia sanguinis]